MLKKLRHDCNNKLITIVGNEVIVRYKTIITYNTLAIG